MSPSLPENEKNEVFSKYMNTLRCSGYDMKYRVSLLKGILQRIEQCETQIAQGSGVRYRNSTLIKQMKKSKMGKLKGP